MTVNVLNFFVFSLQVVEVLTESLTLKETPIPTKVARLMLVSDILHNSSAPVKNASAYRTKFEAALPDIMESFNDLYRSITGRITAEALKVSCNVDFYSEFKFLFSVLCFKYELAWLSTGTSSESVASMVGLVSVFRCLCEWTMCYFSSV